MRLAVDAMGGDFAPQEIVKGAVDFVGERSEIKIILVGDENGIKSQLNLYEYPESAIEIAPASQVIEMHESPAKAIKRKPKASILVTGELVRDGEAQGMISAGSTGAAMVSALTKLGRLKGIERPAIAAIMPTLTDICILIDAGANMDCKPTQLVEFALMGSVYAELIFGKKKPKVGLLNVGEEEGKGNGLVLAAYELLKKAEPNFIGNVEGKDVPHGKVDVAVCDGFTGNIVLKFAEGIGEVMFGVLKREASDMGTLRSKLGIALLAPRLRALKKRLDSSEYGGAPLLGVNGTCIIAHGRSNAKAIKNALRAACEFIEKDGLTRIRERIERVRKIEENYGM